MDIAPTASGEVWASDEFEASVPEAVSEGGAAGFDELLCADTSGSDALAD